MISFLVFVDAVLFNATGLLLVVLGVFLLIRAAGFPDLTVDGSFTIGAALYATALTAGYGTPVAVFAAFFGGAAGGFLTWAINDRLGVGKVVSSVISMIILILSAPYISGGATKSLLNVHSLASDIDSADAHLARRLIGNEPYQTHLIFSASVLACFVIIGGLVAWYLTTRSGLRLRYLGMAVSPTLLTRREQRILMVFALALGNALVALGGVIEAQRRGGYTNNMGTGMLIVALTVLVLGEAMLKSYRRREYLRLWEFGVAIVFGTMVYSTAIQALLASGTQVVDLRLLTALVLLVLLGFAGRAHSSSAKLF